MASDEARAEFASRHPYVKSARDVLTQFKKVSEFNEKHQAVPPGYCIEPGDLLVSAGNGRARVESNPAIGTVIGKAIESHNSTDDGVINIMITLM